MNTYGYVLQNPLRISDVYGLAPGDFYAANDMINIIASENKWKVPNFQFNSPPNMSIGLKGATPYSFDFNNDNIDINTYSLEFDIEDMFDECLSDKEAQDLFNTYVHETIHANGGVWGDLRTYLQDAYSIGSGHDDVERMAGKIANKYASQYNKLRKSKGYVSDELNCKCK